MTEPLDVYIHTSGVVELRPANIPDHLHERHAGARPHLTIIDDMDTP